MKRLTFTTLLLLLQPAQSVSGFRQDAQSDAAAQVQSTTVLVDVVVRDKKGNPVRDLGIGDFTILEDGVPQEISHFEAVAGGNRIEGQAVSVDGQPMQGSTTGGPVEGTYTALVFDRLSPNSRAFTLKAASAFLESPASANSTIGVFFADLSLRTLQPFTSNVDLAADAVNAALGGTSRTSAASSGEVAATRGESTSSSSDLTSGAPAGAGADAAAGAVVGQTAAEGGLSGMADRMGSMSSRLLEDQQGFAVTTSLMAVIETLRSFPGRKSILFFSEGFPIPPAVEGRFRSVINAANRSNVVIYGIDTAGLRLQSTGSLGASQIFSASNRGGDQLGTGIESNSNDSMLRDVLERNETALRADAHGTLNRLADSTGGVLIRETNNLDEGMEEIELDMRNHYVLGYVPKNRNWDGNFREVEVKVDRSDVRLRHRKGYFGLPPSADLTRLDDASGQAPEDLEAKVIALLESGETAGALPVHSAILSFPRQKDQGLITIVAELPPGNLAYAQGLNGVSNFAFVALVRDSTGKIVDRASQRFQTPKPGNFVQRGDGILFYREMHLPPGNYQFQVAGYDAVSGKLGLVQTSLAVQELGPELPSLSSIVLVRSAEPLKEGEPGSETPFHYQDLLFYPTLDDTFSKGQYKELTFFFSVYPGSAPPTEAIVEVLRYNQSLGRTRVALPAPDSANRIQYASSIPISDYPAGTYTLKVLVPAGDKLVSRSSRFLLTE